MKKILVFLIVFLLLGSLQFNTVSTDSYYHTKKLGCQFMGIAFAANIMQADSYFFTVIDNDSPTTTIVSPVLGAINQAIDVPVVIDVTDLKSGVNLLSGIMNINGVDATYTAVPIANGYRLTVNNYNWGYSQRVDINATMTDKVGNTITAASYFFTQGDIIPPNLIVKMPVNGANGQAIDVGIVVEATDTGTGVNPDSFVLTVNGENVTYTRENIVNGYRWTVTGQTWGYNAKVDIHSNVSDNAE